MEQELLKSSAYSVNLVTLKTGLMLLMPQEIAFILDILAFKNLSTQILRPRPGGQFYKCGFEFKSGY